MTLAITTKVLPATDRRGTRIVTTAPYDYLGAGKRCITEWDHSLDADENHRNAADSFWSAHVDLDADIVGSARLSRSTSVHLYRRS